MNKEREFDMLENADEKTVELLAEIPVLTKEEKERMLVMSKKKLDMMKRENNITFNSGEDQVSGVERYSRPKWRRFAAMAACLALVGGIAGTVFVIGKSGKKSDKDTTPMATVTTDGTETPTSPAQTSTLIGEGEKEIPYLTDAELLEVAKKGLDDFNTIQCLISGYGVKVDKNDTYEVQFADAAQTYYRVTDERFSSIDDVNGFIAQYCSGKLLEGLKDNVIFKENNGKLYYNSKGEEVVPVYQLDGEPSTGNYDGENFRCSVPMKWAGTTKGLKLDFSLVDGKWYISNMDITDSPDLEIETPDIQVAYNLLGTLSRIEGLSACGGVDVDGEDRKEIKISDDVTYMYCKVLEDPNAAEFKNSLQDIQSWFDSVCTGEIHDKYKSICYEDGDYATPVFKEFDGQLYQLMGGRGTIFNYCSKPKIGNVTSDSFDIYVKCYEPGDAIIDLTVNVVNDGGAWKLNSFVYDYENAHEPSAEEAKEAHNYTYSHNAMYRIVDFENLAGGGVRVDTSDEQIVRVTGASVHYYRVMNNGRHSSVSEIENEIKSYAGGTFCENLLNKMNGDVPMYKDIDGKLYCREGGEYCTYNFTGDYDINESTDTTLKFTAQATVDGELRNFLVEEHYDAESGIWQVMNYSIVPIQ